MRTFLLLTAVAFMCFAQETPVDCLKGARFQVDDLAKAREFYGKVFGLAEKSGAQHDSVRFQINSQQYLEFSTPGASDPVSPLKILVLGVEGQPGAALKDQDGHRVEFTRSAATDFKSPAGAISDHLLHIGQGVADMNRAIEFYSAHFGGKEIFRRPDFQVVILRVPGPREDWVEFIQRGERGGDHICLDVPDIQRAYQILAARGVVMQGKPRIASNGHWVINMMDSNGVRVELMESRSAAKQ